MNWIERHFWAWRNHNNHADLLNRTTTVQEYLIKVASGKLPPPDAAKCKELAEKLQHKRPLPKWFP